MIKGSWFQNVSRSEGCLITICVTLMELTFSPSSWCSVHGGTAEPPLSYAGEALLLIDSVERLGRNVAHDTDRVEPKITCN